MTRYRMTREEARQIIASWLVSSKGAKGQCGYIEGWFDEEDVEAFRMATEALSDRPTGEWVLKEHLWECDQCGCRINRAKPLKGNIWNYNYCPNCGAIMKDGGE